MHNVKNFIILLTNKDGVSFIKRIFQTFNTFTYRKIII